MGRFKAKPAQITPKQNQKNAVKVGHNAAVTQFVSGSKQRVVDTGLLHQLDPLAKPTNGLNLRLNDYELNLVRVLAQAADRSMQKTLKRLIIPVLEVEVQRLMDESSH